MSDQTQNKSFRLGVVLPVYNDWESARALLVDLAKAVGGEVETRVFLVDDGSDPMSAQTRAGLREATRSFRSAELIRLVSNQGHQRAISCGLVAAAGSGELDAVVVMDSDGEDRPEHIPALIGKLRQNPDRIIVASRARRLERALFKTGYFLYRLLFRAFTGRGIGFGNYMLIPGSVLGALIHNPNVGSHLAAAVSRSRIPLLESPVARGRRYAGESRMSYTNLVVLGLNAITVYSDVALVRLMFVLGLIMATIVAGMATVLVVKLFTDLAIPGWATYVLLILGTMLLQSLIGFFFVSFLILSMKQQKPWIPAKDAPELTLSKEPL